MIKDRVRVILKAGKGGRGAVKFGGGTAQIPTGGNGGKGGDFYIEGSHRYSDLAFLNPHSTIEAADGEPGDQNRSQGKNGDDYILKVPPITEVYNEETNELICIIKEVGQKELILKGGFGGLGNFYFRKGQATTLKTYTPGKDGEMIKTKLVFKLVADIVFIGLPNAGKSSMLNALTNANVKVGNYPFTTLSPHLGSVPGMKLMDLPGLIEGTSQGKGLGSSFIKHTEHARGVAHFLSLESDDLVRDYNIIKKEIDDISPELSKKPELIVLTKADLLLEEEIQEKVKLVQKLNKNVIVSSAFNYPELPKLVQAFRDLIRSTTKEEQTESTDE